MVTYEDITVKLTNQNGNVFHLLGLVRQAMQKHGVSEEEIKAFYDECLKAGSYNKVLQHIMRTVHVE